MLVISAVSWDQEVPLARNHGRGGVPTGAGASKWEEGSGQEAQQQEKQLFY